MRTTTRFAVLAAIAVIAAPAVALSQTTYKVTVTNLTAEQTFTAPVAATHALGQRLFRPGQPASPALAAIAEDGASSAMLNALAASDKVFDIALGGSIGPGESTSFTIDAAPPFHRLSLVGMLVSTNDGFYGLDSMVVTGQPWRKEAMVPAYDAGSEGNNESCDFVPGPPCSAHGARDVANAEGFVHVHPGIRGDADVDPIYDWRNPVARVVVTLQP